MEQSEFNSWSFTLGLMTGFTLRSTDVVPLIGGFIFGLCVRNLPDVIQLQQFPTKIQELVLRLASNLRSNQDDDPTEST